MVRATASSTPGLEVLLLFGSRARGDGHEGSDWDFAFIGTPELNSESLRVGLVLACGTERVDLVDLQRAGGLIRYRVARDGKTVFERTAGAADEFRLAAADFWCDAGPTLERAYEAVLADLPS